jgi:hypothetical protein
MANQFKSEKNSTISKEGLDRLKKGINKARARKKEIKENKEELGMEILRILKEKKENRHKI